MKPNWYIIGTIVIVAILIAYLMYTYRDKLFSGKSGDVPKKDGVIIPTGTSVFPLKNGTYNTPEVGKVQAYLRAKGGKNCTGNELITIDNDFGNNTECAAKQILGVTEITEAKYKELGLA